MLAGDWGLDRNEAQFRGVMHSHFDSIDSDDPAMVPVVQAARDQGYEPAPEAPLWCFLPAIWPGDARAWVRDTRVRHAIVSGDGESSRQVPWSTADYADIESDTNSLLGECGIPPRPAGRLWLLKPPPNFDSVEKALDHLLATTKALGEDIVASASFAAHVDRELRRLFSPKG